MSKTISLANQMKHRDREMVPKVLVQAMFALMIAAVALVSYARLTGREVTSVVPHSDIVREISVTLEGNRSEGVAVPSAAPVRIVERENGHVAVIDDTTGWKIELIGYGQDNVAAFARLID